MSSGGQQFVESDPRALIAKADDERHRQAWLEKRRKELMEKTKAVVNAAKHEEEFSQWELTKYVLVVLGVITAIMFVVVYGLIYYLDNHATYYK